MRTWVNEARRSAGADEGTLSVAEGASLMRVLDRAPAVRHQRDRAVLGASGVQHGPFGWGQWRRCRSRRFRDGLWRGRFRRGGLRYGGLRRRGFRGGCFGRSGFGRGGFGG